MQPSSMDQDIGRPRGFFRGITIGIFWKVVYSVKLEAYHARWSPGRIWNLAICTHRSIGDQYFNIVWIFWSYFSNIGLCNLYTVDIQPMFHKTYTSAIGAFKKTFRKIKKEKHKDFAQYFLPLTQWLKNRMTLSAARGRNYLGRTA